MFSTIFFCAKIKNVLALPINFRLILFRIPKILLNWSHLFNILTQHCLYLQWTTLFSGYYVQVILYISAGMPTWRRWRSWSGARWPLSPKTARSTATTSQRCRSTTFSFTKLKIFTEEERRVKESNIKSSLPFVGQPVLIWLLQGRISWRVCSLYHIEMKECGSASRDGNHKE